MLVLVLLQLLPADIAQDAPYRLCTVQLCGSAADSREESGLNHGVIDRPGLNLALLTLSHFHAPPEPR